jgi:FtsK/SpoIIIE family
MKSVGNTLSHLNLFVWKAIVLLSFLLLLSACVVNPSTPMVVVATPTLAQSGVPVLEARSTLETYRYWQDATATSVAYQSAMATQQASISLTRYAEAEATATQQSIASTATVAYSATQVAGQYTATAHAVQMKMTVDYVENLAELDRMQIEAQRQQLAHEQAQRELALERQRLMMEWIPAVIMFFGVAFLCVIVTICYWLYILLNPVVIIESPDRPVLVNGNYALVNQQRSLPANDYPLLPSGPVAPAGEDTLTSQLLPANWSALIRYLDVKGDELIPIGVDANRLPILINRAVCPHLLIVGTTGSGKSFGGARPYIASLVRCGVKVIVLNGRGADFNAFGSHPDILLAPRFSSSTQSLSAINEVVMAMEKEIDLRDKILQEANVKRWDLLPPSKRHSSEIVTNAQFVIRDKTLDIEERNYWDSIVLNIWRCLKRITNEARKFGMYVILTMTDPTEKAIGTAGMIVRSQMVRLAFRMNDAGASRTILGTPKGSMFPNGSVGLPTGEFMHSGGLKHGIGFHPTDDELDRLLSVSLSPEIFPENVTHAVMNPPGEVEMSPKDKTNIRAKANGLALGMLAQTGRMVSLNEVACELVGKPEGERKATGDEYKLAAEALQYRIQELDCEWSKQIVEGSNSKYVQPLRLALAVPQI